MVYCCLLMSQLTSHSVPGVSTYKVVGDEESLPFPSDTFDLAVSSLRYTHLATLGFILLCCKLSCDCQIMCMEMMVVYTGPDKIHHMCVGMMVVYT